MSELALQLIRQNIAKHEAGEDATYLDLGNCGLSHLPPELGECIWLETLILSNEWWDSSFGKMKSPNQGKPNRIASIKGLEELNLLKTLVVAQYLSNIDGKWEIHDLSPLSKLTHLQILNCSGTNVRDLSPLTELTHLQILNCSRTKVRDLSPLTELTHLQILNYSETKVGDLSPLSGLVNLKQLECHKTEVSNLSPLSELLHLQELNCSETRVTDLSPIQGLKENLTLLWCVLLKVSNWEIVSIFSKLEYFGCGNSNFTDCNTLSDLMSLNTINLYGCQIKDISPLSNLKKLEDLQIGGTHVTDFSPLSRLLNLQKLRCHNTQLSDLYPISGLLNLQLLECHSTQVRDLLPLRHLIKKGIPVKWGSYLDENGIAVEDCPLTNPPREIVEQGNEAILNYFAEKERAGTEKSLEAKVVLIGEGQAGKTSLRTRLLKPGEALPNKEDRTKGLDIDIEKYQYTLANGEIMRLNVFDFGGQDHYKPLHQFFYSKNTLYVLVSKNGDTTVNDFDYWLDTAQLFGQNSPVLLVHNLFGDVRSSFNRKKYARFDETIKECLDVNLGDFADKRWNEVKSHIEYFASRLPHVHEEIPQSWANVRRALTARREEQVLDLEDYLALCALEENEAMDETRALRCSAYLHDIGIILHYQDDPDLREYVIVKNEWATDAAYRVIDDPQIAERKGRFFRQTDLPRIWHQPEYRKMRPQLLQLMRNFRLCYPLKAEGEFIAPQLLPASPPQTYVWQPDQDLILYIEYDFMPLGLMSQLIVECHLLIAEERQLVWRDGAVLELPGGEARAEILLQKRNGKQTIGIRAQGRKKRELMTVVDAKLEELHRPFGDGLKLEKKIPCVCARCAKTDDKWFFNLSELENRLKAGRKAKECEISFDPVSIEDLLGNVFSETVRKRGRVDVPRAFFSYAKEDESYLLEFKKHLSTFCRNGELLLWDDSKICPGEEWDDAIKEELAQADFIFLLVSVDFLSTDYIWDTEIPEAIRRHHAKEATVIPIKIRSCEWSNTPLAGLQGLPRKDSIIDNPINDRAWTEVVQEIGKMLKRAR